MQELDAGIYYWPATDDAPVVVLLHSSQSASSQWRQLIKQMQGKAQIIAIDLLGYGQAPQPEQSVHFRFAQELPRIHRALQNANVDKPIQLIGHSYGGALALAFAVNNPELIERIAVYEPVSFHVLPEDSPGMLEIREVNDLMHGEEAQSATRSFVDYWNQPGYFDALPDKIQGIMTQQAAKVALDFDALINEPLSLDDYAQLHKPVLLLTGEYTRRSAQAVAKALASALPNCTQQRVTAGHMGPLTHPAEVNPLIIDFL